MGTDKLQLDSFILILYHSHQFILHGINKYVYILSDEIIKLNRKEKRKQLILQSQKLRGGKNVPSRGNASTRRGRGSRGRYFSRQNASHSAMVFSQVIIIFVVT